MRTANRPAATQLQRLPSRLVAAKKQLRAHKTHLIDPRRSKRLAYWDSLTGLALLWTAIVTPFEVVIFEPASSGWEPLFLFNRLLDAIFIGDMLVQFNLMVEMESSASRGSVWLTKSGPIAKNYLAGWFCLDIFSILTSAFDFTGFAFVQESLGGSTSSSLAKLKILRVLRALRLIKLARLLRASRMLKRWETRVAVNYAYLSLVRSFAWVLLLSHWFACLWILQAKLQDDVNRTWMVASTTCDPADTMSVDPTFVWECPALESYMAALYFASMTITSIGYGDITATKGNWIEQCFCIFLMFISDLAWIYVTGVFVSVITNADPERTKFHSIMDELNRFIAREKLDPDLARRIRAYFHRASLSGHRSSNTSGSSHPCHPSHGNAHPEFVDRDRTAQNQSICVRPSSSSTSWRRCRPRFRVRCRGRSTQRGSSTSGSSADASQHSCSSSRFRCTPLSSHPRTSPRRATSS